MALETLRASAERVVSDPHGTAHGSMIPGIPFAGKTGTAQNPAGDDHSWFTCYAPAHDPKLAVAVIVENAGHGSTVAAPMASALVQHYLSSATSLAQGPISGEGSGGDSTGSPERPPGSSPSVLQHSGRRSHG